MRPPDRVAYEPLPLYVHLKIGQPVRADLVRGGEVHATGNTADGYHLTLRVDYDFLRSFQNQVAVRQNVSYARRERRIQLSAPGGGTGPVQLRLASEVCQIG